MDVLAKNGVLAMVSVTGGSRQLEVPADKINLGFVLGNKVAFGSVNANREYFESGVKDLSTAELQYPGWLKKLLTHPVKGLENYAEIIRLLTDTKSNQGILRSRCNRGRADRSRGKLRARLFRTSPDPVLACPSYSAGQHDRHGWSNTSRFRLDRDGKCLGLQVLRQ